MSETATPDTQSGASPTSPSASPADIPRYLLQFLLASQGVCHEYTLLAALLQLARDLGLVAEGAESDATHWHGQLREHIETANVRLEPLQFHVAQVQLGSGKRAAMAQWRREMAGVQLSPADTEALSQLPDSSRYYVHVNTQSSPETRTGTWMTPQQVEFAKWCVAQFAEHGSAVQTLGPEVAAASAGIRADIDGASGSPHGWRRCVSYSVGSTQLAQYPGLSAIETEQAVAQLCERRWLARTSDGRVGLAVRAAAELDSLLRDTYALPRCAVCARVVLHGAACGNLAAHVSEEGEGDEGDEEEDEASSGMAMWHVDCYQHYVAHVSKSCPKCSASIVDDAVYVL